MTSSGSAASATLPSSWSAIGLRRTFDLNLISAIGYPIKASSSSRSVQTGRIQTKACSTRLQRPRSSALRIAGAFSGCAAISSGMAMTQFRRLPVSKPSWPWSVAMSIAASSARPPNLWRLTFRSTGRAGTCFDLRRASRRRAGYLQR